MSENRVCCNCRRNIRTRNNDNVVCHCEIDGHYIGYIECMTGWCRRWASDEAYWATDEAFWKETEGRANDGRTK